VFGRPASNVLAVTSMYRRLHANLCVSVRIAEAAFGEEERQECPHHGVRGVRAPGVRRRKWPVATSGLFQKVPAFQAGALATAAAMDVHAWAVIL
jgi:hypothetical protein